MKNDKALKFYKSISNSYSFKKSHIFIIEQNELIKENKNCWGNTNIFTENRKNNHELWCLPFKDCTIVTPKAVIHITDSEQPYLYDNIRQIVVGFKDLSGSLHTVTGQFILPVTAVLTTPGKGILFPFHQMYQNPETSKLTPMIDIAISHHVIKKTNGLTTVWKGEKEIKNHWQNSNFRKVIINSIQIAILYFNFFMTKPKYFIIQETKAKKKKGKIRTKGRSLYKFLHITDIRRNYIPHSKNNSDPIIGTERRRHPRILRSEYFTKMQGKTIMIASTWIGPTQVLQKGVLYKILKDIGFDPTTPKQ